MVAAPTNCLSTNIATSFVTSGNGFQYADEVFRGANQLNYASGACRSNLGASGDGALGGIETTSILNMSGGWRRTFTPVGSALPTVQFTFNMESTAEVESDEESQATVRINDRHLRLRQDRG
jgi:hypothetical protein